MKNYFVYILSNKNSTVPHTGVTGNIESRLYQHRHKTIPGFTQKYNINKLLYFEEFTSATDALKKEKQLKNWKRKWKLNLIKTISPGLIDPDPETSSG